MKINNKGSGLVLVILVMAVMSILGVALLSLSSSSARLISYQNKVKQAYYIAKSGADATATYIINHPSDDSLLADKTSDSNTTHFTNGEFKVEVANGVSKQLNIIATGKVSGVEKSTTAVMRRLTVGELINKAIYTNEPLDITGMKVEGDIQSGGNISYKTNGSNAYDTTVHTALANSPIYMDVDFPDTGSIPVYSPVNLVVSGAPVTISSSYKFNSITIEQNKTLNISLGNLDELNIVADEIIGKGSINIIPGTKENARVNLIVKDLFQIKTKGEINNEHPKYLRIYMEAGSKFDLQAGIIAKAYIIAPDAAAIVQSDKSTIIGSLIANKLSKNEAGGGPNGSVIFEPINNTSEIDDFLKAYQFLRWEE